MQRPCTGRTCAERHGVFHSLWRVVSFVDLLLWYRGEWVIMLWDKSDLLSAITHAALYLCRPQESAVHVVRVNYCAISLILSDNRNLSHVQPH